MDNEPNAKIPRKGWGNARMHLKLIGSGVGGIESVIDGFSKKGNRRTNRWTNRWTDHFMEKQGRIKNLHI